ncbi:MAG: hypothetical protein OXT67_14005, partial [Zetaproteobacteria bacterium]|nr:hypothetical protein [Zetaproteobacteria bacterium]
MYTNVAKNRRLANRYPLFRGDYPTLILCRPGEKDLLETELVDRSCDGLGLFAHSSYNLSEGDQVELFIASSPEKKFRAVIKRISASTHPARQGYRIGVYFQFNEDKQPRYPRLYLRHKIQNVLAQDLFDEDQSHIYSISDVSLTGLTLETHNPESILIPQQTT